MKNSLFRKLLVLVLAFSLCTLPALAAPSVPEPTSDFYVGDFANVLSDELEQYIVEQNQSLYEQNGAQIAVVTVDFLDGYDIDDYAVTLFNEWEIGSAEYNNGFLILLAIADDNYYSVPGKGLEDVLTGGVIDDLQWNYLEDGFADKDYDRGVRAYFDAVLDVVEEQAGAPPVSNTVGGSAPVQSPQQPAPGGSSHNVSSGFSLGSLFVGIVVLIIVLAVVVSLAGMRTIYIGGSPYRRRWLFWGPMVPRPPRPPRPPRRPPPPPPPPRGGFGGGPGRPGGFGGSGRPGGGFGSFGNFGGGGSSRGGGASRRPGGSGSRGGFGGFGGSSRGGGFGGSRGGSSRGGGGMSRGGGAGRRGR